MSKAKKKRTVRDVMKADGAGGENIRLQFREPRAVEKGPSGVLVAVDGDDHGTVERHGLGKPFDPEQKIDGMIDAIGTDYVVMDGRARRVRRAQDSLDLLKKNGTISDDEYNAGRRFQRYYLVANKVSYGSLDPNKIGNGVSREMFIDVQLRARMRLDECCEIMGGAHSLAALAFIKIVGQGYSINDMVRDFSHGAHMWRGALIVGMQVLCKYFDPNVKRVVNAKGVRSVSVS